MILPTKNDLIKALTDASSAHHEYEQTTLEGVRDQYWAGFYAAYVLGRLGDFVKPSTLNLWLEETSGDGDWATAAAVLILARMSK